MIRTEVDGISVIGRITSGVKVMNLDEGVTIANMAKVRYVEDTGLIDEIEEGGDDASDEAEEEAGTKE